MFWIYIKNKILRQKESNKSLPKMILKFKKSTGLPLNLLSNSYFMSSNRTTYLHNFFGVNVTYFVFTAFIEHVFCKFRLFVYVLKLSN